MGDFFSKDSKIRNSLFIIRPFLKQNLYVILLFIFILLFWGGLEWWSPNYFLYDDNVMALWPLQKFNWESLFVHGQIPFVNYYQHLGDEYLSQGYTQVFSPLFYLGTGLSLLFTGDYLWGIDCYVLASFLLSGLGMLTLLRRWLELENNIALLISMVWVTLPFIVLLDKAWSTMVGALAFLPLVFMTTFSLLKRPGFKTLLIAGAVKALAFYSGHPHFVFILFFTEAIFLFFYFWVWMFQGIQYKAINEDRTLSTVVMQAFRALDKRYILRLVGAYVASIVAFICLVGPLLFPMLDAMNNSAFRDRAMNVAEVVTLAIRVPQFFQAQVGTFAVALMGHTTSVVYFIGPLLLTLPFFAWRIRRQYRLVVWALFFTTIFVFILATLWHQYFLWIPLLDTFRWPFKYFPFFAFLLILISGFVCNRLWNLSCPSRWRYLAPVLLVTTIILNTGIVFLHGRGATNALGPYTITEHELSDRFAGVIDKHRGYVVQGAVEADFFDSSLYLQPHKFLAFNYPTFWKYFHFTGYNPLIRRPNYVIGLPEYRVNVNYYNNYNFTYLPAYIEHFTQWGVRYFIVADSPTARKVFAGYEPMELIYEQDGLLVYEHIPSLPLMYLKSNPTTPVDFEVQGNNLVISPNNTGPDELVVNFVPSEFYSYQLGSNQEFINLDEQPIDFLNPMSFSLTEPVDRVTLKYTNIFFYFGVFVVSGFIVLVGTIWWLARRRQTIVVINAEEK